MLKGEIINGQLLKILGETGHADWLAVSDSGLPVPLDKERVDLAFTPGKPRILDVLKAVTGAMAIEKAYIAEEIRQASPNYHQKLLALLKKTGCEIAYLPHVEFKAMTRDANMRACIRSGELTSYSSVILQAGVNYGGEQADC
jgi:D-ribose pyranase